MRNKKILLENSSNIWSDDSVRFILTPSDTAKSIHLYAQEVGYFKTIFPYFCERQNLDSFLMLYTISGQGILKYMNSEYSITTGHFFFIDCREHHSYATVEGTEWEFYWIHFHGNNALGYYKEFIKNGFQTIQNFKQEDIILTFQQIITLYQKHNSTTELLVSNLIHGLVTELLLQTVTQNFSSSSVPTYIKAIAQEIEKNFREDLTLAYFEQHYYRSRFHILKEFKKYIGSTVGEYLILTRISHAKELLKYSPLSVSEIASEVGINHTTHFINLFKSREGMTPLAYRKTWN